MGCGASSQSEQTALSTRPLPTQHPAGVTTLSPHPPAAAFRYPTVDERSTSASPPFLDGGDSNTPQHLQQPSSRRSSSRQQQQQRLSAQDTQISLHLEGARPPQPHPPFTSNNNSLGATPSRHLLFGSALSSPSSSSHHHHLRTDDEYSSRDQVHHSRSATPLSSASGVRSSMLDGVGNHMELHRHQSLGSTAPSEFGGMMGGVGSSRSTTVGGATTASLQQVTLMNPVSSSSPASAVGLLLGVVVGASGNSSSVGGRGGAVKSFAPIDPSGFDPPLLEDVVADDFLRTQALTSMPGSSASSRTTRKNENDDLRSSSSTGTATILQLPNAAAPPPLNNAATTAKSVHCPQTAYSLANVSPRMTALKTMTTTSSVSPPRQHLHQRSVSNPLQQGATATAIVETTTTTTTTTAKTESASTTTFSQTTAVPPPFPSQGVFHFNSNNNDNSPTLSFQPPNGSFDAFRLSPQQTSLHSNPQQQRRLSTSSPSLVGVSEKRPDDQNALISVLPPRRGSGGDQQQRHHQPPPRSKHQFNKDSPLPTNGTSSLGGRRGGGTNPAHSASSGASAAPAAQLPEGGAAAATALSPLVAGGVGFPSTNSSIKSSPSSSNRNVPPENLPFVNPQSPSSSRKLVVGNGSFSSSATSTIANHCELSHLQFSQFGGGLFNPQEQNDEISDGGGGVASGGGAGGGISCEDLITSQQKSAAQPPATAQTTASPSRHQPLRTTPKAAKNTVHVPNHHHHHPQGSKYEQHDNSEVYGADDDGDNDDDELQSSGHSLNSRKKSLPAGTLVAPGGDKEDDEVSEHDEDVDEATTAEAANRQHLILPHITKKLSHRNPGGGGGHTPLDPEDFDDIDVTTHQPLDGEEPEGEQKGKSNEIGGIGYNKENRASVANFAPSSSGAKAMTHQHRLQRGGAAHSIRGDVDSESNLSRGVLLLPHAHSEGGGIVVVVGGQLQPTTSGSDAPPVGAAASAAAAAAAALPPLSSPFRPLNFLQLNPQSMSSLISGESVGAPTWPTTAIEID